MASSPKVTTLLPGLETWVNKYGQRVIRCHWKSDPEKDTAWYEREKAKATDIAFFYQEVDIDFNARAGAPMFNLNDEATLCDSFPIPHNWTRYQLLDPHIRTPHASLWVAVSPESDAYAYRELWPSKVCGISGNIPENDNLFTIKQYVEAMKWLESAENPDNGGKEEQIFNRIIDFAARAFGQGTSDDPEQPHFQKRFEDEAAEIGYSLYFEDSKKDKTAGVETVNDWLKPGPCLDAQSGQIVQRSRLRIFRDKCPELIWELRNNRWVEQTSTMADKQDPVTKAANKRNHLTDLLRYFVVSEPEWVDLTERPRSSFRQLQDGIAY